MVSLKKDECFVKNASLMEGRTNICFRPICFPNIDELSKSKAMCKNLIWF
jgi:hypothetical protein